MTSRFGKTYSRRGGEGTSKFDEVLSTKRGTLSTKWGDTTYKAKVGSKRAGTPKNDSAQEVSKRSRPSKGDSEDPFGFDSDEESKPVSSRGGSKSSPGKPAFGEPPQAERPSVFLDTGSKSSFLGSSRITQSDQGAWWGATNTSLPNVVMEDTPRFVTTGSSMSTGKSRQASSSSENQHSYSWYQNASESDRKPLAQTTTLKTGSKTEPSCESWDVIMGLRPPSPNQEPRKPAPTLSWASAGISATLDSVENLQPSSHFSSPSERCDVMKESDVFEVSDISQMSSMSLERNSNCRTYRRPNKQGPGRVSESSCLSGTGFGSDLTKATAEDCNTRVAGGAGSRGRTRDYTVLHPSSVSMCNVTFQSSAAEELNSDAAPASGGDGAVSDSTGQHGVPGWQRKKVETQISRQTKSKKESKPDLFGFDQEENSSNSTDGSSTYKIKYFGFDDMSDSDGAEDDDTYNSTVRRRAKRGDMSADLPLGPLDEAPADVPDPFERLQSLEKPPLRESKRNAEKRDGRIPDVLDFSEEGLRVLASGPRRPPPSKPSEKNADSLRRIFSAQKKSPTKAVYNARHWTKESEEEPPPPFFSRSHPVTASATAGETSKEPSTSQRDDGVFKAPPPPPKVTKCVNVPQDPCQDTVTTLKCHKEHKELYTVVQHVKHFNDVVEFGENQEFTDDFEYLATGLKSGQPLNTRCLSVISLASRCAMPSFRMHLRARGKVAQVFKTLNDAPQHPNLALCTAALMYILSRDRLNMDLDRSCLDLMIRLLELDQDQGGGADSSVQFSARELAKIKEKIRKLCDTVHNKHLDLQNITTGHLAMETLLSLTSKRAGDWFKEELRLLGGLDHIVDKVKECVENLDQEDQEEKLVSSLWGAERCLRVLDSVTAHNPENQSYLIAYKDSSLIVSAAKALRRCEHMIQRYSRELNSDGAAIGKAVEDCMRAIIGVLLNLTHDNEWGSTKTGEQPDLISTALNCVLKVPQYLPQEQRFDIRVLGLGLLINLVEYSARNRYCLMEMEMEGGQGPCDSTVLLAPQPQHIASPGPLSAIAALVQLFIQREQAAILAEAQTDDLIKEAPKPALDQSGEWQETGGEIQWVANDSDSNRQEDSIKKKEDEDEPLDLNKALQHAGKHMEDSIVASYTALLLGCLCQGSPMNVTTVRENLPRGDFSIMTEMLKKFLNFMNLTCDVGTAGQKSISRIIDYLEHC
ncbi:Wings apart-like-like protein [Oryzias melastigma]|uniref:Wings apart-like protein homolog n=1 Tax=Oryzias melastigma TaxID=30732 RepID=A0A3B3DUS9_ORYME|nr:wings apart-like protein homolog [Oryzias melastigma]KAF6730742.1 Wings apart-like-like protein [Oryzias melastigma]